MCGIAGKVSDGEPVAPELIARMCDLIKHRGPDAQGAFVEGPVGLGIQRLAIIDLATGDQPIFNEDRSVVLVLNGEIYNYRELREELVRRGHRFATRSDTEVIVHLYEEVGEACVQQLRGMFAFALWDRRARRLLLARDRVGKKPLFYSTDGGTLRFASEPRSILADPAVPREVDLHAVDLFLHYRYVPDPMSAFRALRKLPPAHTLTWQGGRATVRRYWKLSYRTSTPSGDGDLLERIRAALLEATSLRMRSDVPFGAFLSGGVDSSAVVAAMAQRVSGPIRTFSIGFDVASYDETRYAREVAELFSTEHTEFRVEPQAIEILPRLVWHYGEPFADESALPTFHLCEQAASHVKVALTGDGGDEVFAGYDRYRSQRLLARLDWVPRPLAIATARALARSAPWHPLLRRAESLARYLSLSRPDRYSAGVGGSLRAGPRDLYTAEFQREVADAAVAAVIREPWAASDAPTVVERLMDVDVQSYLPGDLLVKVDIASMAHSLELRSPLLDHELMEVVAALPAEAKLHRGEAKRAFRDALRPWLPGHILDRRKMGFGVPLAQWFRGPLRGLPAEVLLDPRSISRGLFRTESVSRLIDEHVSGTRDHAALLWSLLQLELWQRCYIDAWPATPPDLSIA